MSFENIQRSILPAKSNSLAPRQGVFFNTRSYALIANAPTLSGAWTMSAIVQNNGQIGSAFIFGGGNPAMSMWLTSSNEVTIGRGDSYGLVSTGVTVPADNKFCSIVSTYDGSSALKVYINGVQRYSGTSAGWGITGPTDHFGAYYYGYLDASFLGTITQPLIYNRALSAAEVLALYESGEPEARDYNSASNTAAYTSDFSADTSGWSDNSGGQCVLTGNIDSIAGVDNVLRVAKGTTGVLQIIQGYSVPYWGRYRIEFDYYADSSSGLSALNIGINGLVNSTNLTIVEGSWQTGKSLTTTSNLSDNYIRINAAGGALATGKNIYFKNIKIYKLGLLLAPDSSQPGGGLVWYDTSGNGSNITLTSNYMTWSVPSSGYWGGNLNVNGTGTSSFAGNVTVTGTGASYSALDTGAFVKIGNNQTGANLQLGAQSGTGAILQGAANGIGAFPLVAQPYGGNLLVGTTSDTGQKLQVKGGTRITDSASASNYITIGSGNDAPYGNNSVVAQTGTLVMGTVASASLFLYTNSTTALTLDSSQRVVVANATNNGSRFTMPNNSAIAWNNAANSGDGGSVYFDNTNALQLRTGSGASLALTLDSSQNAKFEGDVSIIKSSAALKVYDSQTVVGGGGGEIFLQHRNSGASQISYASVKGYATNGTIGAEDGDLYLKTMRAGTLTLGAKLTNNGNFIVYGTGTSSFGGEPSTGLASYTGNLRIQSGGNGPAVVNGIELQNSQSGSGYGYKIYTNNSNDYIGIAGRFNSATWTEFVAIKQNTGNVGIGTTAPTALLQVGNGSAVIEAKLHGAKTSTNGEFARLTFSNATDITGGYETAAVWAERMGYDNSADMVFGTATAASSPTERMRITSGGNVGIGTTDPTGGKLHLKLATGANFQEAIYLEKAGGYGVSSIQSYYTTINNYGIGLAVDNSTKMVINQAGNVLIGSTSDSGLAKLQVASGLHLNTADPTLTWNSNTLILRSSTDSIGVVSLRRNTTSPYYSPRFEIQNSSNTVTVDIDGSGDARLSGNLNLASGAPNADVTNWGLTPKFYTFSSGTEVPWISLRGRNDAQGANIALLKSRATDGTANTAAQSGDELGNIFFVGADGASFIGSALIRAKAVGTIASTRVGGQLEFYTATDAAPSVSAVALTINNAQKAYFANNVIAASAGSAGIGFEATAGIGGDHRFSLTRYDTNSAGSVLLSAFGGIDFMYGATTTLTSGTIGARLDTSGNFKFSGNIGIGGTAPTTSGTGITFPATQSASSNANTLDDYEEGTFTATLSDGTTDATGQSASYTKIGRTVIVKFQIYAVATTSFSTTALLKIKGLPFAAGGSQSFIVSNPHDNAASLLGQVSDNDTTIGLYLSNGTNTQDWVSATLSALGKTAGTTISVYGNFVYQAT